jgi:D-alanine-D-alanine ligase
MTPQRPRTTSPLSILVLYNRTTGVQRGAPTDRLPDMDEEALGPVLAALVELGHVPRTLGITYKNLSLLDEIDADFVLNLCDGTGLDGHPGLEVATVLARRRLRFSGAGPSYYWLSSGKWLTKRRLSRARVPVPSGAVMPSPSVDLPAGLRFPLIVKPRDGFGSLGIDESSVVKNLGSLRSAVRRVMDELDTDALVEEFIDGRELTVALLGQGRTLQAAPPLELRFGHAYDGRPRVRTFSSKFDAGSELYHGVDLVCPAPLEPAIEERVRRTACRAYRAVGGDSYGRVDMRLSAQGTPYVLEVNANPCLDVGPEPQDCGTFLLIARAAGWSFPEMIARIIHLGLVRRALPPGPPLAARWHHGRMAVHALRPLLAGERLMPLGPLYPAAPNERSDRTLRTSRGRVHVDPSVSYLAHSDQPRLEIVVQGGRPWLIARRGVDAGEELTLDRSLPLPMAIRPPVATGRRARRSSALTPVPPDPLGTPG